MTWPPPPFCTQDTHCPARFIHRPYCPRRFRPATPPADDATPAPAEPKTAEVDAGDVEALAARIERIPLRQLGWTANAKDIAEEVIASDWLAALLDRERRAVKAEAWDEGRRFGQTHWASNYYPEVEHRPDPNPYRADALGAAGEGTGGAG